MPGHHAGPVEDGSRSQEGLPSGNSSGRVTLRIDARPFGPTLARRAVAGIRSRPGFGAWVGHQQARHGTLRHTPCVTRVPFGGVSPAQGLKCEDHPDLRGNESGSAHRHGEAPAQLNRREETCWAATSFTYRGSTLHHPWPKAVRHRKAHGVCPVGSYVCHLRVTVGPTAGEWGAGPSRCPCPGPVAFVAPLPRRCSHGDRDRTPWLHRS